MGVVYAAEGRAAARAGVAAELLPPGAVSKNPGAVRALPPRSGSALRQTIPTICAVYDSGLSMRAAIYLITELLEAQSLHDSW